MIPIYLCDPSGRVLERLEAASGNINRHIDQIGTLEVTCLPPRVINQDYRILVDVEGENRVLWLVTSYEEIGAGDSKLLQISAKDGKYLYTKRLVRAYSDTALGYKINYPQVVAAEIINEQVIAPLLTYRGIPGLALHSTPGSLLTGFSAWEGEVAWKNVWEVFGTLMEFGRATDNPFMVDLLVSPASSSDLLAVVARRAGTARRLTSGQLARYGFSIRSKVDFSDNAEEVISLGAGPGSLALYTTYPTTTPVVSAANPFYYKEEISVLSSEDDLDALSANALATYQERRPKSLLIIEGAGPVADFWGPQLGYGDEVTILYNDRTYTLTVVGYSIQWSGASEPNVSLVCAEGY
jgi:hypothetical protein